MLNIVMKKLFCFILVFAILSIIYFVLYEKILKNDNRNFVDLTDADDRLIRAGDKFYHFKLNKSINVYESNSKPIIWLYWHDDQKLPDYGKILIETIFYLNPTLEIILVDQQSVTAFWLDCNKDIFSRLSPAHQSDVFRVHILKLYGGVYLDVDTFSITSLAAFYDLLVNHHLVGSNWTPMKSQLSVGHLGPSRANISLFQVWAYWQDRILEIKAVQLQKSENSYPLQWSELLADIATPLAKHTKNHKLMRFYQLNGLRTVGQLVQFGLANDVLQPLTSVYGRLKQLQSTPLLYFHNSKQMKSLQSLNVSDLLESEQETVFGFLAKCSLIKCYERLLMEKNEETHMTKLNIKFLINVIEKFNTTIALYPCVL